MKAGSCSPWSFRASEDVRKRDTALCNPGPVVGTVRSSFDAVSPGGDIGLYGEAGGCAGEIGGPGADAGAELGADVGARECG